MLGVLLTAAGLVPGTVAVHAVGTALLLLSYVVKHDARPPTRPWPITWALVAIAWLLRLVHAVEIALWGLFYRWSGCLPDAESAFYFPGVTYTTIGYGDVVLPKPWRILGRVQGATGILMVGLSTGLSFAVLTRIFAARSGVRPK